MDAARDIGEIIGWIPQRLALAGGWIDQPFMSRHDPQPPGSMVVVGVEPTMPFMDRCGLASSTRKVADTTDCRCGLASSANQDPGTAA